MRFKQQCVYPLIFFAIVFAGCKKSPTDSSSPVPATATGSYIAFGEFNGETVNAWLAIFEADDSTSVDSTGASLTGFIQYQGIRSVFLAIEVSAAGDSLNVEFVRDVTRYRASAAISSSGLLLAYSEPEGQAAVRFNREIGGYNLTGYWSGEMSSNDYNLSEPAVMVMDQQGAFFNGDIDVEFLFALHGDVTSGVTSGPDFSLTGTARISSSTVGFVMQGQYVHADTVVGSWSAGTEADSYTGNFLFARSFD